MGIQQDDKTIVAQLEQILGQELGARAEYNEHGQLITLKLSNLGLTFLLPELGQLSNLQYLSLNNNQLTQVPVELAQLSNLREIYLHTKCFNLRGKGE